MRRVNVKTVCVGGGGVGGWMGCRQGSKCHLTSTSVDVTEVYYKLHNLKESSIIYALKGPRK